MFFISGAGSASINNSFLGSNQNVFVAGLLGAGIGGLIGGVSSGIEAYSDGKDFWTGTHVNLKTQLNYLIEQHKDDYIKKFGKDTYESTKFKAKYLNDDGRTYFKNGKTVDGVFSSKKQVTIINKNLVKANYSNSYDFYAEVSFMHEGFHSNDFHKGVGSEFINELSPYSNVSYYNRMLEVRAYSFELHEYGLKTGALKFFEQSKYSPIPYIKLW